MLAPRDYRDCELCFCLQKNGVVLTDPRPRLVRMAGLSPDFEETMKQRISFSFSHLLSALEPPVNLIVEIRTSDPNDPMSVKSTAWTVMPLFNPANEPNFGRWRLPVYRIPTNLNIDLK
jgi:hypothetical protein